VNNLHRLGDPLPRRIAIVRVLPGLGDFLCAVPALRALRAALPKARITLIGLPSARACLPRFAQYLDDFLEFPGYPGIPEHPLDVRRLPAFLTSAHARKFDLAIQMHGNGVSTNPFTVLLGARRTAGFYEPGQYCPDPERFLPYPAPEPEVWRHLRLLEFLGVPLCGADLEFPVLEADRQTVAAGPGRELPGEYVCIHPGASDPTRRWPPERFAVVADALAARGLGVVLTGSESEAGLTGAVARAMRRHALDLAGQTDLGALGALLSGARLLICNDTGVSHLAAALRTPSVVIFTNSESERWAPLDCRRHRAVRPVVEDAVLAEAEDLLQEVVSDAA